MESRGTLVWGNRDNIIQKSINTKGETITEANNYNIIDKVYNITNQEQKN